MKISNILAKESDRVEPTMNPVAPTPTAAPVAEPVVVNSVFADPKKLTYEFESYMEAGGKIPPAMRGVLKDILLTALGTVESRQRKLNNIVREAKSIQGQLQAIKKKQTPL